MGSKTAHEFSTQDKRLFAALTARATSAIKQHMLHEAAVRASQEAREQAQKLRALADNIPQLAWMADETGARFWFNQQWYEYTGATFDDLKGWGWQAFHHPDYLQAVDAKYRRAFATGQSWEDTYPLRGKDGCYRWFLGRAVPIARCGHPVVRHEHRRHRAAPDGRGHFRDHVDPRLRGTAHQGREARGSRSCGLVRCRSGRARGCRAPRCDRACRPVEGRRSATAQRRVPTADDCARRRRAGDSRGRCGVRRKRRRTARPHRARRPPPRSVARARLDLVHRRAPAGPRSHAWCDHAGDIGPRASLSRIGCRGRQGAGAANGHRPRQRPPLPGSSRGDQAARERARDRQPRAAHAAEHDRPRRDDAAARGTGSSVSQVGGDDPTLHGAHGKDDR